MRNHEPGIRDVLSLAKRLLNDLFISVENVVTDTEREVAMNIFHRCSSSLISIAKNCFDPEKFHNWERKMLSRMVDQMTQTLIDNELKEDFREVCVKALCFSAIVRRATNRLVRDKRSRIKKIDCPLNSVEAIVDSE